MNWKEFKQTLQQHTSAALQFQYGANSFVNPSYHITEIKQAPITSVDCGGVVNRWTEVIVQLWEPAEQPQQQAMAAGKALSIIDVVEKALPLDEDAIVKIEFGNLAFDTRQMLPQTITSANGELIVNLQADTVQCKAIERGGNCGTTAEDESCCEPVKPKVQLVKLAVGQTCTPGGGCC